MSGWQLKVFGRAAALLLCAAGGASNVVGVPKQDGVIHKPEIAAARLYDAWRKRDRAAASEVAPKEAVGALFARRWAPMEFKGCGDAPAEDDAPTSDETPSYLCTYVNPADGATLDIAVSGGASVGFSVSAVAVREGGKAMRPSDAAARLFDAWRRKDRRAALQIASKEAVDKLFGTDWHPMKLTGCSKVEKALQCVYREPKLDYTVSFSVGGAASTGYRVAGVSFSTEE